MVVLSNHIYFGSNRNHVSILFRKSLIAIFVPIHLVKYSPTMFLNLGKSLIFPWNHSNVGKHSNIHTGVGKMSVNSEQKVTNFIFWLIHMQSEGEWKSIIITKLYFAYWAGIFGNPNSSTRTPSWLVATLSAPGSLAGASGAFMASSK